MCSGKNVILMHKRKCEKERDILWLFGFTRLPAPFACAAEAAAAAAHRCYSTQLWVGQKN